MNEKSDKIEHADRKRAETVKGIRSTLGRTQSELAAALGISTKAVQSYEQGWRSVPVRVLIQLVVLLALYRKQAMDDVPCWEIRKCPSKLREACTSFKIGRGQFCWFVGSQDCRPVPIPAGETEDALPCMRCPVVKRLLRGPADFELSPGNFK